MKKVKKVGKLRIEKRVKIALDVAILSLVTVSKNVGWRRFFVDCVGRLAFLKDRDEVSLERSVDDAKDDMLGSDCVERLPYGASVSCGSTC